MRAPPPRTTNSVDREQSVDGLNEDNMPTVEIVQRIDVTRYNNIIAGMIWSGFFFFSRKMAGGGRLRHAFEEKITFSVRPVRLGGGDGKRVYVCAV